MGVVTVRLAVLWAALQLFHCVGASKAGVDPGLDTSDIPQSKIDNPRPALYKSANYTEKTTPTGGDAGESVSSCETGHKYGNDTRTFTCEFTAPANSNSGVSVHFSNFETESNYDMVYLYDETDTLQAVYHGKLGSFWTENIPGRKAKLRFATDSSVTGWGFKVDKFSYGATETTATPPETVGWVEAAVNYESTHGLTFLGGKSYSEEILIRQPGALELQLHFRKMAIDLLCLLAECQVKVEVFRVSDDGSQSELVKKYAGSRLFYDQWQNEKILRFSGDTGTTAKVKLSINTTPIIGGVFNEYGFKIDKINVKTATQAQPNASKYPIVLVHGMGGFDTVLGIDYFFRVRQHLKRNGYQVFITETAPFGTLQTRVNDLYNQLENLRTTYGFQKFNLIGHSMGGLDIRALISENTTGSTGSSDTRDSIIGKNYGQYIATATTIATPHHGSRVADILLGIIPGKAMDVLGVFINFAGGIYNQTPPSENEIKTNAYHLTEKFCSRFNLDHPVPTALGSRFFTFAGVANPTTLVLGNADEVDLFLVPTFLMLYNDSRGGEYAQNDGLVSLYSAKYQAGYYRQYNDGTGAAALKADHFNQVGQILGITDPAYHHLDYFLWLARYIAANEP